MSLYIEVVTGDCLILEGIQPCDIFADSYETGHSIIRFGDKAAINLNNFISYQFKKMKKDCCTNDSK
jgi:hypothetical protein